MNEKPLILACDDDAGMLNTLRISLKGQFDVHTASTVVQAKALSARHEYDAAIIDLNYEGQELDGIHLLDHFSKKSPNTFLIVLSGADNVQKAVEATRRKLFEFVYKSKNFFDSLTPALDRVIQIRQAKMAQVGNKFLTASPQVHEVIQIMERIVKANSDASILINGETGVGKEYLARHVGKLKNMRVVTANMANISKDTADSVLCGHERGAFTGALANKVGLIESADGGIFFLDEIGECPLEVQAKLLRVIEQKEVLPMGSNRPRRVNVHFMAATHRNLAEMVEQGLFRQDLLQRLNVFVLKMPPLRERPEDIQLYANYFLADIGKDQSHYSFSNDAMQTMLSYPWPGNVRELSKVIKRIHILSDKTIIDRDDILHFIKMEGDTAETVKTVVDQWEGKSKRELILNTMADNDGNKRKTANALGISQSTFYRWVQECGIA